MRLKGPEVLSCEEIDAIHRASLRILAETGVAVECPEILKRLRDAGVQVDFESQRTRFSESQIEEALRSAPSKIAIYDRNGRPAMTLGDDRTYAVSGMDAIYILDSDTGERREATKVDTGGFSRLADALEHIHMVAPQVLPQDVMQRSSLPHGIDAMFNNTEKPLIFAPFDVEDAEMVLDLARIALDVEDLSASPALICLQSLVSPLCMPKDVGEVLLKMIDTGVPFCFHTAPQNGMSAPITLAGLMTQYNAEMLSAIVISQWIKRGTPVIYGGGWGTLDMHLMTRAISSPESALMRIAGRQMSAFYRLPYHAMGLDTDAHSCDEEMGWEKMLTALADITAGVDLMVNAGMFGTGMTASYEQLILDHEILGIAYRFAAGFEVDEDRIALEVIQRVGPRGYFITEDHTLKHLRSGGRWEPVLSNRHGYEEWQRLGGRDILQKASDEAKRLLKSHHPKPLDTPKRKEMTSLIRTFEKE